MTQPEFVRIDNQPVRVTSIKVNETTGSIDLVIVARGSNAAGFLAELGAKSSVNVEIPDESTGNYIVTNVDIRTAGAGEQSMNRARFTFQPLTATSPSTPPAESQLDRIERKLDDILTRLE